MRKWKIKVKILDWGLKDGDPRRDALPKEDEVIVEEDYIDDINNFDPNYFGPYENGRDDYTVFWLDNDIQDLLTEKYGITGDDMDNYFGHVFDMFIESMELLAEDEHWRVTAEVDEKGKWNVGIQRINSGRTSKNGAPVWTMRGVVETDSFSELPLAVDRLAKSAGRPPHRDSASDIMMCGVETIKEWKTRRTELGIKPGYRKEFKE